MELMSLLLEIAEATGGTFGCLRKCDFPYNGGGERFKRVGDVAVTFRSNGEPLQIYLLPAGGHFGMGDDGYSRENINCLQVVTLDKEIYQHMVHWKRTKELLSQQWTDMLAAGFIASARAAMRA